MKYGFSFFVLILFSVSLKAQIIDLTKACTDETFIQYDNYVKQNAPSEDAFISVQRIVEPYIAKQEWDKAVNIFKTYTPLFKALSKRFEKIINLLNGKPEGLISKNLGKGINTTGDEYTPIPTADGKKLYFTGNNRHDCVGREDIFVSDLKDSIWQNAVNLGKNINTMSNEYITGISTDGNSIIFFGNYRESFGSGDLFYVDKTDTGWSKIGHFPSPINTTYFDCDGMMTPDGKAIIFSSDRPGAVGSFVEKSSLYHGDYWGNIDIYVCLKTDSGWSEPINLGPKINTPYAERTPFLHPDGKTLYFSSDGHYGLGRLDVFVSTRQKDDSWTQWSEPINLGKEINTPGQDYCFKISTSGETGYLAASNKKEGLGGSDIFTMSPLPVALRPKPVVTISGKVTDKNMHPLAADIKWESLTTGETVGQLRSDPKTGDYFIVLALGHNYGYYAEKKDYYPTSFNIDLQNETQSQHRIINIILYGMDTILQISNVFFESGRAKLKQESFPELNRLAKIVKANPDKKLEIAGHTDSVGSFDMNMRLSKDRAQAVVDYLILVGCPNDYFTAIAYGPTKPVATNKTPEGRQRNRRVEFRFTK